MGQENLVDLRNILAKFYADEQSIRRIVADVGIEPSYINFSSSAINTWFSVLTETIKAEKIDILFTTVDNEYGDNSEFQDAWNAYYGAKVCRIPVVIAAMTYTEAVDLITERIFKRSDVSETEHIRFTNFKNALQVYGVTDFISHYAEKQEMWKPPPDFNTPINIIIQELLPHINKRENGQKFCHVSPHFISGNFFSQEADIRRETRRELERSGGIVIIDAISLFHPILYSNILRSGIWTNKQVALLILSPVDATTLPVNQLIVEFIDSQMEPVFTRFHHDFDRLCEIGIGNLQSLKRWLFSILPETAAGMQLKKPNPYQLQQFQNISNRKRRGIDGPIFGQGG